MASFYAGQTDYIQQLNNLSAASKGDPGSTWYSGTSVPTGSIGIDGDYYLKTDTGDIYKRVTGAWNSPISNIKGANGSATVAIGTTTTLTSGSSATLTNSGTSTAAILNFGIPRGADGTNGSTGLTGPKGLNSRGVWAAGTNYAVDDWATYGGSSWHRLVAGTTATVPSSDAVNWEPLALKGTDGAGAGSVLSVSVVSANGFAGTVATATSTPAITLTTSITGLLKGNGTAISAAASGTDYGPATSALATGIVKSTTGTGAHTIATVGTDYSVGTSALATGIIKSTTGTGALSVATSGTDYSAGTSALGTGIVKSTTATGALTIAVAGDFPTLNQSTTGNAATATTLTGVLSGALGGSGVANTGTTLTRGGNVTFSGAFATTFTITGTTTVTFPTSGTLLSTAAAVTVAQGGTGATTAAAALTALGAASLVANTFNGDQALTNNKISGIKIAGFNAEYDNGNSSTAITITLANAQKQKVTLTASSTITISTTGAVVGNYQLRLIQDATGSRAVTWSGPSASRWLGNTTAPAINLAINGETMVSIYFDGTNMTQSLSKIGAV
jgi:hypothetical protein